MPARKLKKLVRGNKMKTYIFTVELEEEDGIWTAVIPALAGCNAWAASKEEALTAIQENARAYLETLIEDNQPIPIEEKEMEIPIEAPAIEHNCIQGSSVEVLALGAGGRDSPWSRSMIEAIIP